MTPLCFIDTETTGVHPDRRAWEVAIIRRDDSGQHETLIQITDVDLSNADPFGLKVGGFYDRAAQFTGDPPTRPTQLLTEADTARAIWRLTHGAHLVGAVPDFDARTLDPMLRRHGLVPAWHYHLIDVEPMAVGWLAAKSPGSLLVSPPWKSDDLAYAVNILSNAPTGHLTLNASDRHTALGDARWAMRWYDVMTGDPS